ncbi:MAG: TetR family transcriptional regulator [Gammaproteobacteria bacterium]|nr:TetR family transcriptional regulator [Gammaproteobacteria bacterium]
MPDNEPNLTPLQRERRKRILDTVRDQLSKNGYDGINMRDLAAAAKVSPTTLYNLYENKDALILSALQDQLARIGRSVATSPAHGLDWMLESNQAVARQLVETPQWAAAITRLLVQAKPEDPITRTLMVDGAGALAESLQAMIAARELSAETDIGSLQNSITGAGWAAIIMWTKDIITLQDLPREYLRVRMYPLLATATPKLRRRLAHEFVVIADNPLGRSKRKTG